MPRDSGGTYTLPAGNPVVSGTIIQSTWANSTMDDMGNEMSDSLSRTGNGAMLAPLRHIDGSEGGPAITFINDPTTGRYLEAAGEFKDCISGAAVAVYTSTGIEFLVPVTLTPVIAGNLDLSQGAFIRGQKTDFGYENLLNLDFSIDTVVVGNDNLPTNVRSSSIINEVIASVIVGAWSAAGLNVTGTITSSGAATVGGTLGAQTSVTATAGAVSAAIASDGVNQATFNVSGVVGLVAFTSGAVRLNFNGASKLNTRTDGIDVTGTIFQNGVPVVSPASVGAAIAGIAYNGIGATIYARHRPAVAQAPNTVVAGSTLYYASGYGDRDSNWNGGGVTSAVAGTWRCMGDKGASNDTSGSTNGNSSVALWVRIT